MESDYTAPAMPEIASVHDLRLIEDDGHSLDGTDPKADNLRRASFAARAVEEYASLTGSDLDTVITDLMGDMRHLLDVLRESGDDDGFGDIQTHVWAGDRHYQDEIRGIL